MAEEKQRILELAEGEVWTPFFEKINDMLIVEKKARHDNDHSKSAEICIEILQAAFDEKEYGKVRTWLLLLCKRRGQAKKAIIESIKLCNETLLEKLPTREEKFNLLQTLRDACEGKMFLEREYANCTTQVVKMYEEDGKAEEATKIIQEIQIETYGSLEPKEKVEFILYQMRLVLDRQDYVRCQILSRKISKKAISEKGLEAFKVEYYSYMVRYFVHEKMIVDAAKASQSIFDTLNKLADEEQVAKIDPNGALKTKTFQNFVIYLLISPYTNEKVDLLNIVESLYQRQLEQEELLSKFVRKFLTFELMPFNESEIEHQIAGFEPF